MPPVSWPLQTRVRLPLKWWTPTSILIAALDNLPNGDANVLVVLAGVGLRRTAPAAIQQDACRLHGNS